MCECTIFSQQVANVIKLCNFRFVCNHLPSKVMEVEPGKVLLSKISKLSIKCKEKKLHQTEGCMFCMIDLPCQCEVQADQFYLPPRVNNCKHQHPHNVSRVYPVNLALLQHFFSTDSLKSTRTVAMGRQ